MTGPAAGGALASGGGEAGAGGEPAAYCGHCGESEAGHEQCARWLVMEPPRYCTACRRRMKVQVTPRGWAATCVAHGVVAG